RFSNSRCPTNHSSYITWDTNKFLAASLATTPTLTPSASGTKHRRRRVRQPIWRRTCACINCNSVPNSLKHPAKPTWTQSTLVAALSWHNSAATSLISRLSAAPIRSGYDIEQLIQHERQSKVALLGLWKEHVRARGRLVFPPESAVAPVGSQGATARNDLPRMR